MKVLMSIKPKYADKIFSGEKLYEYRRAIWKRKEVDTVVVYASAPVCKIIGDFKVSDVTTGGKGEIWCITSHRGCISGEEYGEYFKGVPNANVISIFGALLYDIPKPLSDYGIKRPPQNFMYLKETP